MDSKLRLERLKHARHVVEQIPEERLFMDNWYLEDSDDYDPKFDIELPPMPDNFVPVDCGTVVCFAGSLGLDKKCRSEGLITDFDDGCVCFCSLWGSSAWGSSAIAEYLGITGAEAYGLTNPEKYEAYDDVNSDGSSIKPCDVLDKIDKLINFYSAKDYTLENQ